VIREPDPAALPASPDGSHTSSICRGNRDEASVDGGRGFSDRASISLVYVHEHITSSKPCTSAVRADHQAANARRKVGAAALHQSSLPKAAPAQEPQGAKVEEGGTWAPLTLLVVTIDNDVRHSRLPGTAAAHGGCSCQPPPPHFAIAVLAVSIAVSENALNGTASTWGLWMLATSCRLCLARNNM